MNTFIEKNLYAIILFVFVILLTAYTVFIANSDEQTHSYSIVVQEGDSLWKIAETYAQQLNLSTIEVVRLFEKENQLGYETILAGDTLHVPKQVAERLPNETHFVFQTK